MVEKNSQSFDLDIYNIYYSYIKPNKPTTNGVNRGIDDYRSDIPIKGITLKVLSEAINKNEQDILLKPEKQLQESRCHAFYRIIGFPVYDFKSDKFYNPGIDNNFKNPNDTVKNISHKDKRSIASNCILNKELMKLYDVREDIQQTFLKKFNLATSIDASVLALSSVNKREFIAPLLNINDPNSFVSNLDPLKASYHIDMTGHVGQYKPSLYEYIGTNNNSVTLSSNFSTRNHIIYPFLTDPRYTETVSVKNSLSVPFSISLLNNKVSETEYASVPMLETIITNRLSIKEENTGYLKKVKDLVINSEDINYEKFIKSISFNDASKEQKQFEQFIYIIQSMMNLLADAQFKIENAQESYYWLPIPSILGPEYGVSVRPIILSESILNNKTFMTKKDYDIISATLEKVVNETASSKEYANKEQKKPVFPNAAIIFNPEVNKDCGNIPEDNLKELNLLRTNELKIAGQSLQVIEMIMGEFSGLGLCDILAIIASLYIIPTKYLLGFLDDDAFIRMKYILNIFSIERSSLLEAQAELTNTVMMFYNLMDKFYLDIRQNKGIS